MSRHPSRLLALAAVAAGAACSDPTASSDPSGALTAALATVPVGYGDLTSSYVGSSAAGAHGAGLWVGGGREASLGRGMMMGGGLAEAFVGAVPFGERGGHRGPFGGGLPCAGSFDAATERVTCPTETRRGLTIERSAQYRDVSGAVQQAFDSATTNSVNLRSSVTGTVTFDGTADSARTSGGHGHGHHGGWGEGRGPGGRLLGDTATILTATTTLNIASDRTVSGLVASSSQRTVNGTSRGSESTTGKSSRGSFSATRIVGDTTTGLVIPLRTDGSRPYPTAGTVIRAMTATLTYEGQSPVSVSRREVVTYDGSATAKVVITENGATRSCTRALPRGELTCN